jgi:hypothetical protein
MIKKLEKEQKKQIETKTQYFVNSAGKFIGAFSENNSAISEGVIEVKEPPSHGLLEIWDFEKNKWVDNVPEKITHLKEELLSKRKAYFATTDWYVARKIKRGVEIPEEILNKEILCAKEIDLIKLCKTLEELQKFDINYN